MREGVKTRKREQREKKTHLTGSKLGTLIGTPPSSTQGIPPEAVAVAVVAIVFGSSSGSGTAVVVVVAAAV